MVQTTFRCPRTRTMVEHARFLVNSIISLFKILINFRLGVCLALKRPYKNGKDKMEESENKYDDQGAALEKYYQIYQIR